MSFSGWYTAASGGTKITTSTVFSINRAVYAQWILEDYDIKFYDYNFLVESFMEIFYGEILLCQHLQLDLDIHLMDGTTIELKQHIIYLMVQAIKLLEQLFQI